MPPINASAAPGANGDGAEHDRHAGRADGPSFTPLSLGLQNVWWAALGRQHRFDRAVNVARRALYHEPDIKLSGFLARVRRNLPSATEQEAGEALAERVLRSRRRR